jgi:plasmid stabilization system protein ParE
VKPRRIRFTETARLHVRRENDWWLRNRDHADVFADELEAALRVVASLPGAGTPYTAAEVPGLRRIYVPKVACHLYYTFDDREVLVHAFWAARRGKGPAV